MEKQFCAQPLKAMICLITVAAAFLLGGTLVFIQRYFSAILLFIAGMVFLWVAVPYGTVVCVDEWGVKTRLLGFTRKVLPWSQIAEVGVAGTRVFGRDSWRKTGMRVIYFSEKAMTEDERFQMILHWPVKNIPFMVYNSQRLLAVQTYWNSTITHYNSGDAKYFMVKDGLR